MKKILHWIKEHLPRWLDLSHDKPWNTSKEDDESTKPLSRR